MKPNHIERLLLRYDGVSDEDVAAAERLPVSMITAARAQLRRRGVDAGETGRVDEDLARMMLRNEPVRGL